MPRVIFLKNVIFILHGLLTVGISKSFLICAGFSCGSSKTKFHFIIGRLNNTCVKTCTRWCSSTCRHRKSKPNSISSYWRNLPLDRGWRSRGSRRRIFCDRRNQRRRWSRHRRSRRDIIGRQVHAYCRPSGVDPRLSRKSRGQQGLITHKYRGSQQFSRVEYSTQIY